jgi:hypothetical protein
MTLAILCIIIAGLGERFLKLASELVDVGFKIANELSQMNLIAEGKRDLTDFDPNWKDMPGMEKSDDTAV